MLELDAALASDAASVSEWFSETVSALRSG
jgi:hypothetical protein